MSADAQEIGFIEDFALAKDRAVPLSQLIPGTHDYYYYHCLHFQNTQQFDKTDEMIAAWKKRHKTNRQLSEIQYRQAVLTYERDPQKSLEFLRVQLGLSFAHAQDQLDKKPQVPSTFDAALLNRDRLKKLALKHHNNLDGFENAALFWLVSDNLNPDLRRALLSRLRRPDCDNLPQLIVDDLQHKNSKGFGSHTIHTRLFKNQLDQLLKLRPQLRNETKFVYAYIARLAPSTDVNLQQDSDEHEAWLDRLWGFAKTLSPAHNSLKAHVLHHRLAFDQQAGERNRERFLEYIKLPRHAVYAKPEWLRKPEVSRSLCNLGQRFDPVTQMRPVGNDEPLVRDYLLHFFVKDASYRDFEPYMQGDFLKHLFAEAKIVNGLGDAEEWYSMLPPAQYQQLKDRVDIDFASTNKRFYGADEPVALDVSLKNVPSLIVKVFEVNTLNYHRENQRDVSTDINLDGMVANDETTHEYKDTSLRRVTRRFEFPKLDKRGTYVIDFIGNGQSSRALIRKGQLRFLVRTVPVGQVFTVLDENDDLVKDAKLFLGGQQYDAIEGKDGQILIPFSGSAGRKTIVLATDDGFSSVGQFDHKAESYQLVAGMYVDRESLLRQRKSQLVVRPQLTVNGIPVSLKTLNDVKLIVTSTDHDGTNSRQEVADFKLFANRETVHEFAVPPRLAALTFTLSGTAKNLTTQKDVALNASHSVTLNRIDTTEKISDVHLLKNGNAYSLEMRGRSGERRPARSVNVTVKHHDFKQPIQQTLATDDKGQIALGELDGVVSITIASESVQGHTWNLQDDRHSYYSVVHSQAGEAIRIPWMGDAKQPDQATLSLLELRNGNYVTDHFSSLKINNGFVEIAGLLPGDYHLTMRPQGQRVLIRITDGKQTNGFLLGRNRQLEQRGDKPLQIESVTTDDKTLTVKLQNSTKFARVHLFATRFVPEFDVFGELIVRDAEPFAQTTPRQSLSAYVEGRNIGDEYRYILERRYAKRFPGNMHERPGMLLNPFVLRSTDTGQQVAAAGGAFGDSPAAASPKMEAARRKSKVDTEAGGFTNLDFLSHASLVSVNLVPNEDGMLTVNLEDLGPHQHIRVVAIDPLNTVCRSIALPAPDVKRVDLRLANSLDPAKHFNQSKEFRFLDKAGSIQSAETASIRMEVIDSLSSVYQLYATLNQQPHLAEFEFVLRWPSLKKEEKQTFYSKHASHELSFFIAQKDPEFFQQIVKPYLQNKMHKTFMDHYLLKNDLSPWLHPWAHARLNVVEQVLLSDRIDGEIERTRQFINGRTDLLPVDVTRNGYLFDTAFQSRGLSPSRVSLSLNISQSQHVHGAEFEEDEFGGMLGGVGGGGFASGGVSVNGRLRKQKKSSAKAKSKGKPGESNMDLYDSDIDGIAEKESMGRKLSEMRASDGDSGVALSDEFFDDNATWGSRLASGRQLYRKLDATQEWVENNYYKLPIEQQLGALVTVNEFWRDFAARDRNQPFVSDHVLDASRNFTEMMLALAVLDLPFESPEHKTEVKDGIVTFTATGPMVIAVDEIRPADAVADTSSILVSQNFYKHNDRYRHVGNQKLDKFLTDEFVVNTVYGCQIAITNPTSAPQSLSLVLQVPAGAIPVLNGEYTKRVAIALKPFTTQTHDYFFYFPADGQFEHYPVQVTDGGNVVAFADAAKFNVVEKPTTVDTESWDYISQFASADQVIDFLKTQNLQRVDLSRIAWRMKDADFFGQVTQLLHSRHVYNDTLWSYAIRHNAQGRIEQYLSNQNSVVSHVGMQIDSPILTVNSVDRHTWQQRDYSPLVNARAHRLGGQRTILNDRYRQQYQSFTKLLSYQQTFDDEQLMTVTYYLLLQDRVEEAINTFAQINPDKVTAKIQYDYCAAYLDFFDNDPTLARSIVDKYTNYPVDRWRNLFAAMKSQLDEINGKQPPTADPEKTQQVNTQLAAADCSLELQVDKKEVAVDFQNLEQITVNYYLMDIELLFSRNPFVQQYGSRFSNIRPNLTQNVELPKDKAQVTFDLPAELQNKNVLVEVVGRGMKKTAAYYSNSLSMQLLENYGQVKVSDAKSGKALSRVYVKTYARLKNGQIRFYKDGYTDLRGRFDYASLNTSELDNVDRFSVLVLSDSHGASVDEVNPPQR